ncbi:MAG: dihydrolipoamide succinyltransferase [Sphingomonadales bacterium]|nr:dihydrolipoamide succinyltransferase [Sphingomonadales bacterium]
MSETVTDVIAPIEQEGTKAVVLAWYVEVGGSVNEGDPLVELETDKVSVEVPAPTSGVLAEILVAADGEAIPGEVLGRLSAGKADAAVSAERAAPAPVAEPEVAPRRAQPADRQTERRLSPAVRRLVREHCIAVEDIAGSGKSGRLTKADVEAHIASGGASARPADNALSDRSIPHDRMRLRIAEHMSHSVATAPHVTAVFEADFSAIIAHRKRHKEAFAGKGVKLTYTAYLIAACVEAMKKVPSVNSRWHDDRLDLFGDVNIGVGTALGEKGLIVPVVHKAQALDLFGIAQRLDTLVAKARDNKLAAEDVRGGTFSISNHGTSGSLLASPIIINQPQSAILGVGKLEKRVVVRTIGGQDAMLIHPMAYVSLTIDHRVLDGAQTNAWLTRFVETIEGWSVD